MKKRMMSILLALILLLSVISPVSSCSAAEEASTEPSVQEPALEQEEEPEPDILSPVIRLQILTKPTFNKTLKAKNGRVSYEPNDDGNTVELDALGNRVGVLPDYFSLDYGLWAAYRGTNKAALALGWGQKPVTDYVYEEFFVQGDCIRAERGEGRLPDFYDFEGHPRSVGKLPAGWTPLFVTSAGTVGATKNGTAAQLFDQKGKALLQRVQDRKLDRRLQDLQDHTRKAGAASHIDHGPVSKTFPPETEEKRRTVQKVFCQNIFKFRDRRQVHDLIDAHELTVVQHQLFDLPVRQIDPCLVKRLIEQFLLCHDNSPQILPL